MATTPKIPEDVNDADPANPPIEFPRPPKAPEYTDPRATPAPQKPDTVPASTPKPTNTPGCTGLGECTGDAGIPTTNNTKGSGQ